MNEEQKPIGWVFRGFYDTDPHDNEGPGSECSLVDVYYLIIRKKDNPELEFDMQIKKTDGRLSISSPSHYLGDQSREEDKRYMKKVVVPEELYLAAQTIFLAEKRMNELPDLAKAVVPEWSGDFLTSDSIKRMTLRY